MRVSEANSLTTHCLRAQEFVPKGRIENKTGREIKKLEYSDQKQKMGHLKIIVDHEKIDYSGPLDLNNLFRMIENFIWERGFDKKQDKDFEQNTHHGKFIEWQISPWKWITDYTRYIIKVRLLGYDLLKTDAVDNGKKVKVDNGRIIIVIDGFIEYDLQSKWENNPVLHFLRSIYDNFIFKAYTERFEQMLVHDINHLHDNIEKFFNLYRHYSVISKQGP